MKTALEQSWWANSTSLRSTNCDEITDFTGFQSTTTNAPIARPQEAGFLLATVLDQDGWKELMQRSFLRPPPGAATDQVWRGPLHHSWGPLGTWRGVTTYTPRGPEGYGIRYDFAHEMSYVPPEPSSGVLPFDVAGAEFQPVQAVGLVRVRCSARSRDFGAAKFSTSGVLSLPGCWAAPPACRSKSTRSSRFRSRSRIRGSRDALPIINDEGRVAVIGTEITC